MQHGNQALLAVDATVYLAGRNPAHIIEAADQLEKEVGRKPKALNVDLNDLRSVKRAGEEFLGCVISRLRGSRSGEGDVDHDDVGVGRRRSCICCLIMRTSSHSVVLEVSGRVRMGVQGRGG